MMRIVQRVLYLLLAFSVALYGYGYYRTRVLRDSDGPRISMDSGSISLSVEDDEARILEGVQAWDDKDGDVTASLVLQNLSNFVEKGRRIATIAAFDSDNNVKKITREVKYYDYESPRFWLEQPLNFYSGTPDSKIVQVVHAEDCLDGDLSGSIIVEPEDPETVLDSSVEGSFRLVYTVVNSAGDVAELPVTVQFNNKTQYTNATKLRLTKKIEYLKRGDAFDPRSYMSSMEKQGEAIPLNSRLVRISDPVDTQSPGVYEVVYTVTEENGENVTQVRLIVIVE